MPSRFPSRASIVLLLLIPAGSALAQDARTVAGVLAYQAEVTDAMQRNDAAAIDTLLADDFTLTDSRGGTSGRAELVAEARAQSMRYTEFRNVDQRVRLYLGGSAAVVTGRTLISGTTAGGDPIRQDLPFTDTLVLADGRWRMVSSHVSAPAR